MLIYKSLRDELLEALPYMQSVDRYSNNIIQVKSHSNVHYRRSAHGCFEMLSTLHVVKHYHSIKIRTNLMISFPIYLNKTTFPTLYSIFHDEYAL